MERRKDIIKKLNEWFKKSNSNGIKYKEKTFKFNYPKYYDLVLEFSEINELNFSKFQRKLFHYMNELKEIPTCGDLNLLKFISYNKGYHEYCENSRNCEYCKQQIVNKRKQTSLKRYGVDNIMKSKEGKKRIKKSNLKKYGVENIFQSEKIKEKIRKTNLERYGVEYVSQSKDFKRNLKNTMIEKYGVEHNFKIPEVKSKIKETNLERYGSEHIWSSNEIREKIKRTMVEKYGVEHPSQTTKNIIRRKEQKIDLIKEKLKEYNCEFVSFKNNIITFNCDKCENNHDLDLSVFNQRYYLKINIRECELKSHNTSTGESELIKYIETLIKDYNVNTHDRFVLEGKELDVYIPKLNLAFEYNGLYWHSEIFKNENEHQLKKLNALAKKIDLIHVWEDDWLYKNEIIKGIIKAKLGKLKNNIGARKCEIKNLEAKEARIFLNENHLQGYVNSKYKYGLFHDNELISVMTFGNQRRILNNEQKEGSFELLRFANKIDYNVMGGFSKLLKHFIKKHNPKCVMSYANLDISNGNVYEKNGFEKIKTTKPGYYWVVDGVKKHRSNYTKQKLIKMGYNKNLTEREIMHDLGYYKIWDSGNFKYELKL